MTQFQLKFFGLLIDLFLIGLIFLKLPDDSLGIKPQIFGGLASAQVALNLMIGFLAFLFITCALQLNLVNLELSNIRY